MPLHGRHGSDNSGRGPSGAVWSGVPFEEARLDPNIGYTVWEDFVGFSGVVASNIGTYAGQHGWYSWEDSGGSIINLPGEVGGVIRIATDNTDNDSMTLALGNAGASQGGGLFKFSSSGGKKLVFETRVRYQETASRNVNIVFAEEARAINDGITTDAGALVTTIDLLGFRTLEGDANAIDTFYQKASQTAVTVEDDVQTITADTWYKLGLVFDPNYYNAAKRLRFFVDGVEQDTGVNSSAFDDTTFPDGEEMTLYFDVKNGTTTSTRFDIDWVRIFQAS